MARLSGSIIIGNKSHFVVYTNRAPVREFNELCRKINEKEDKEYGYYLSVDASTTCTGFCLAREDLKFHIVFDYERKSTSKEQFIQDLNYIFQNLVYDLKIKILLVERPIQQAGGRAKYVLSSLSSDIKKFIKDVPEFDGVRVEFVRPNSWKSAMTIKSKGKGRYNSKACMAEDIKDRYPIFTEHWRNVMSNDMDSFDAIGILYFYLERLRDKDGNDVNFGTIEFTHHTIVATKYVNNIKGVLTKFPQNLMDKNGYEIVKWNKDYSYYENIKMASTKNKIVIMIHEDDLKNQIRTCWESGLPYIADKKLALFIFRHTSATKGDLRLLDYYNYKTFMVY